MKGPKRANGWILWRYKVGKTFYFCDRFLFKWQCIYCSWKGCKGLNEVRERETICQYKVYERGSFFVKNVILKGKGLDLWAEPPRIKVCWVPPQALPLLLENASWSWFLSITLFVALRLCLDYRYRLFFFATPSGIFCDGESTGTNTISDRASILERWFRWGLRWRWRRWW